MFDCTYKVVVVNDLNFVYLWNSIYIEVKDLPLKLSLQYLPNLHLKEKTKGELIEDRLGYEFSWVLACTHSPFALSSLIRDYLHKHFSTINMHNRIVGFTPWLHTKTNCFIITFLYKILLPDHGNANITWKHARFLDVQRVNVFFHL